MDLRLDGEPDQTIEAGPAVGAVGVVGADARVRRLDVRVAPGERVTLGDPLFVDRARPDIRYTSPASGTVVAIDRTPRRDLGSVAIELGAGDERTFPRRSAQEIGGLPRERIVADLLESGLWTALRTRPFGRVPDPDSAPRSLFVTAIESDPLAPRADLVIAERSEEFVAGLRALERLTPGRLFVCKRAGADIPVSGGAVVAELAGPHPAGLPGTHIHLLDPVGPGRTVWHLGYPDVIAIGALFQVGRLLVERVVALGGPAVRRPRLVRTRLGASTDALLEGELLRQDCRILSGSVLSGRQALGSSRYLGRFHTQVCALAEKAAELHGGPHAFFPLDRFDRVLPLDLPAAPLLRALLIGDLDAAADLGCLELEEEDLALCTFVCPAKIEYGPLLRTALDTLERQL